MFDTDEELQLYEDFLRLASQRPQFKASNYIRELWEHKGTPICATQLYTLYQMQDNSLLDAHLQELGRIMKYLHQSVLPELPIEIADSRAIHQVREFIQNLRCDLEEAKRNNDLSRIAEDVTALEQAEAYILSCLSHNGRIKPLRDIVRNHGRLIHQAVQGFIESIYPEHPRLADYIALHIVTGKECYWSADSMPLRD
jgi:hypothetical protein